MTTFGSYELLRRLGTGGTAEVYLAAKPGPGREELLALKIVLPHLAEDGRLRETLLHEARTAALVRHRNVVEIYEVGEAEGRPFLAMEFVRGWPLNTFLKQLKERDQALTIPEVCAIVRDAALGLDCAHEATDERGRPLGLIHRDISPHNLILRDDGRVKVVDFGLAKATLAPGTRTGGMKGKIAYMPPEQIENKPLDRRVDVFAAGAVLWELLAGGEKLHPGRTEAEILQQALFQPQRRLDRVAPGLPRELVELVERALERDVRRRLPTALALAEALEEWVSPSTHDKLAHRLQSQFEPLPRTVAEARSQPALRRPSGEKRPTHSSGERPKRSASTGERPARGAPTGKRPARAIERPAMRAPGPQRGSSSDRTTIQPSPVAPEEPGSDGGRDPDEADPPASWAKTALSPVPEPPASRRAGLVVVGALTAAGLLVAGVLALRPDPQGGPVAAAPAPSGVQPPAPGAPLPTPDRHPGLPTATPPPHAGKGEPVPRARLVLRSNVTASVHEGGKDLGLTPMTIQLPAGPHHLELKSLNGPGSASLDVTLQPGEQVDRTVELPAS